MQRPQGCAKRFVRKVLLLHVFTTLSAASAWISPGRLPPRHRRHVDLGCKMTDADNLPQFYKLLRPTVSCDVDRMSGTDLAYVGDVVYELFVRSRIVWPSKRTSDLQKQAVALVRAEHQSKLLSRLKEEFALSAKEIQVLNRGRNAGSGRNTNRRDPSSYQDSTAIEALLGYLYIADTSRCGELLQWIDETIDHV